MSNSSQTGARGRGRSWGNSDDERKAGKAFLDAVLGNDTLRANVVSNRAEAHSQFKAIGQIDVPNDVEVICVEPTKDSRKKVVLFILPEKGAQLPTDTSVLQYWVQAWSPYSSARFKRNIKHMGRVSTSVLSLRPVTFKYKSKLDAAEIPQFGLIAEEVEKANPDLVMRDSTGRPYGVRYDAVSAMLLNEFIKQHRTVGQQERIIARQSRQLKTLDKRVNRLSARILTKPK